MLNFMWGLSEILGIKVAASMAYHLQTDGQTERSTTKSSNSFASLLTKDRMTGMTGVRLRSLPITTKSML